jgi:hypothetical protein
LIKDGIEYLDEDAETFPDGSVHDATLARDSDIQGIPCAGGWSVVFFPGGRLRLAWLSRPVLIGAIPCAAGIVYLHENGAVLNSNLSATLECSGITVAPGRRVTLDQDGQLLEYSCPLDVDQSICGLPCTAKYWVWLYPSGRLSNAVLAASAVIGGRAFARGTEIFLNEDGQVDQTYQRDLDDGHQYKQRIFGTYTAAFE